MRFKDIIEGLLAGKKYTYAMDDFWWIQFGEPDDLDNRLLEIRYGD